MKRIQMLWDIKNDRRSAFTKDPSRLFAIQWGIGSEDDAWIPIYTGSSVMEIQGAGENIMVGQREGFSENDWRTVRPKIVPRRHHTASSKQSVQGNLSVIIVPIHYIVQMFLEMKAYKVYEA